MSSQWFYMRGTEKRGPFSAAELKRCAATGQLSKDDLVLRTGAANWVKASQIKGLFPAEATQPTPPNPPQPSNAGKKKRSLLTLLLVGSVLSACGLGLIVAGVAPRANLSDYIRPPADTAEDTNTFLRSFDQHPPPILESIKDGKRVWLLDGYRSDTTTGKHKSHKEALYAVFDDGKLEYVVLKTHHDPIASKEMYQRNREVDTWEQMPVGESQPFQGLQRSLKGKEESPEHAKLELEDRFAKADNPDSIIENVTQVYTDIRYNKDSTSAGWTSRVYSSSSVKTRGEKVPRYSQEKYKGVGKLLQ